ncbi:MerR family transcriptional regulator [Isoptericola sp. b408]|uniref:MerR family transcriptional regulator n=1 Tax=Isoptericola sp. b408 TaxID=3064653 RepID=UPI0027140EC9|nr:MerR family transcriptional regulator [Isoptericola sp. b408]MDO8150534.1 MerR family transcriptional regulator [Isoptericola sp. b408]
MSTAPSPEGYSIGELARAVGMSTHTLRWYESRGLFPREIPRTESGRRRYEPETVEWLRLLARLRASGMPVARMAEYARLVRGGEGNEDERIALMEAHSRALTEQIDTLVECREVIDGKVAGYRRRLAARPPGTP